MTAPPRGRLPSRHRTIGTWVVGVALVSACGDDSTPGGQDTDVATESATEPGATTTGSDTMSGGSTPGTMTDTTVTATTGETETGDPTTDTETGDPTTDTGGCSIDDDCMDAATPFCDGGQCVTCDQTADPDGSCAGADAGLPVCAAGVCVQCSPEDTTACGGTTPVCDVSVDGGSCVGCTEHAECPGTACHLDGPDAGACFEAGDVQMAANETAVTDALAALGPDGDLVLNLTGSNYNFGSAAEINTANGEVAILGDGSTTIGSASNITVMSVGGSATVYFSGVTVNPTNSSGLICTGTSVWLDDSGVVGSNNNVGLNVSSGCAAHLRRSVVAGNSAGGIDISGGELSIVNSAIGANGSEFNSEFGGITLGSTQVDIRYSTIAANTATTISRRSLWCTGGESGVIRNSIIVSAAGSIEGCGGLTFESNAVDHDLPGNSNVGAMNPAWFLPGEADYHLTATGQGDIMEIAMWADGDPLTDVDGDPIPTDMPSFPGYDQP